MRAPRLLYQWVLVLALGLLALGGANCHAQTPSGLRLSYEERAPDDRFYLSGSEVATPLPNPAADIVRIDFSAPEGLRLVFELNNFLGSPLWQVELERSSGSLIIDLTPLQPGLYFYSMTAGGELIGTRRLVVRR